MNAIEMINLKKTFHGKQMALCDVSFTIKQGEIFGFLGSNGAGKTTAVRLLNGILEPSGGKASVLGMDVSKQQVEIHKLCGVMTETALMYENLSGLENLNFFGRLHGMPETAIRERSSLLLDYLELSEAKNKKVKAYSTGMKRRLSIARALLHSPKVLFLDEPTSGLDPEAAMKVTKMIRQLSIEQGVTVFLCTHQLKYAEEICTLYGFIHQGRMLGMGTFEELLKQRDSKRYVEIRGENLPDLKAAELVRAGKIRITIQSDAQAAGILQDILSRGGQVYEARQVKWNLEDLYFSFQKGEDL